MSDSTTNNAWGTPQVQAAIDAVAAAPTYVPGATTGYLSGNSGTVNTSVTGGSNNDTSTHGTTGVSNNGTTTTGQFTNGDTSTAYTGAWAPYANSVAGAASGMLSGNTGLSVPGALSSVGTSAVGYLDPSTYQGAMAGLGSQATGYGAADAGYNTASTGLANSYSYNPQTVGAYTVGTQGYSQSALHPYLDPYTSQVTNATMALLNQQQGANTAALTAAQARSGNFGDRAAVALAQNAENNNLVDASTLGSLTNAGYNNAQAQFNTSNSMGLQAQEANQANVQALQVANQNAGLSANAQNIGALTAAGNLDISNRQTGLSGVAQASANANNTYQGTIAGQTALANIGNTINIADATNYAQQLATQQAGINALALGTKSTSNAGTTTGGTSTGGTQTTSNVGTSSAHGTSTTDTNQTQTAATQSAQQGQVQNLSPAQLAALKTALGASSTGSGTAAGSDPFSGAGTSGGSIAGGGTGGGGAAASAGSGYEGAGTSIPSIPQTKDSSGNSLSAPDPALGQAVGLPAGSVVKDANGLLYYTYTDPQNGGTVHDADAANKLLSQGLVDSNGKAQASDGNGGLGASSTGSASITGSGSGTGLSDSDLASLYQSLGLTPPSSGSASTSSNDGTSSVQLADGGSVPAFALGGYVAPALPDSLTHRSHHKQLVHAASVHAPMVHAPMVHAPMAAMGAFGGHVAAPVPYVARGAFGARPAFADGGATGAFGDPDDADDDVLGLDDDADSDASGDDAGADAVVPGSEQDTDASGGLMAIPTASDLGFAAGSGAFGAPSAAAGVVAPSSAGAGLSMAHVPTALGGLGQPTPIDAMSLYGNSGANALALQAGQAQLGLAGSIQANAPHVAYQGLADTLKASTPADLLLGMLSNFTGNQALSGFGKALEGARAGQLGAAQTNAAIQNNAAQREVSLINNLANNARQSNTAQMTAGARLAGQQLSAQARMGQMLFKQSGVDPDTGQPRYAMDTNPYLHGMAAQMGLAPGGASSGAPPTATQMLAAQGGDASSDPFAGDPGSGPSDPFSGDADAASSGATPDAAPDSAPAPMQTTRPHLNDGASSAASPGFTVGQVRASQMDANKVALAAPQVGNLAENGSQMVAQLMNAHSPMASGGLASEAMGGGLKAAAAVFGTNPLGVQDAAKLQHNSEAIAAAAGSGATDAERSRVAVAQSGAGIGSLQSEQMAYRQAAYNSYRDSSIIAKYNALRNASPNDANIPEFNSYRAQQMEANPLPDMQDPRMFPVFQQAMDQVATLPASQQASARAAIGKKFTGAINTYMGGKMDGDASMKFEQAMGAGSAFAAKNGYAKALMKQFAAPAAARAAPVAPMLAVAAAPSAAPTWSQ